MTIPAPDATWSPEQVADWVEWKLLFEPEGRLSRASLRDQLEEEPGTEDILDYDQGDFVDLGQDGVLLGRIDNRVASSEGLGLPDSLSTDTFFTLENRASFVGSNYPLRIDRDFIVRTVDSWRDASAYAFMVALNGRYVYSPSIATNRPSRLFERLVTVALREYSQGEAEHFGWPRSGPAGSKSFPNVLPGLVRRLGERIIVPVNDIPGRLRDHDVDAFAWRPFGDRRRGQIVYMCQCAIGADWDTKAINPGTWAPLMVFAVTPIRCAAFPFVPAAMRPMDGIEYEVLSTCVGLWFDRLRLGNILAEERLGADLKNEIVSYTEELISAVEAGRGAA